MSWSESYRDSDSRSRTPSVSDSHPQPKISTGRSRTRASRRARDGQRFFHSLEQLSQRIGSDDEVELQDEIRQCHADSEQQGQVQLPEPHSQVATVTAPTDAPQPTVSVSATDMMNEASHMASSTSMMDDDASSGSESSSVSSHLSLPPPLEPHPSLDIMQDAATTGQETVTQVLPISQTTAPSTSAALHPPFPRAQTLRVQPSTRDRARAHSPTPQSKEAEKDEHERKATSRSLPNSPYKSKIDVAAPMSTPSSTSTSTGTGTGTSTGMFAGMRILFLLSVELTSKRIELLTAQVVKRGGKVIPWTSSSSSSSSAPSRSSSNVGITAPGPGSGSGSSAQASIPRKAHKATHIIFGSVSGDFDGRIRNFVRMFPKHDRMVVAEVGWMTKSLARGRLVDVAPYRLDITTGQYQQHPHQQHQQDDSQSFTSEQSSFATQDLVAAYRGQLNDPVLEAPIHAQPASSPLPSRIPSTSPTQLRSPASSFSGSGSGGVETGISRAHSRSNSGSRSRSRSSSDELGVDRFAVRNLPKALVKRDVKYVLESKAREEAMAKAAMRSASLSMTMPDATAAAASTSSGNNVIQQPTPTHLTFLSALPPPSPPASFATSLLPGHPTIKSEEGGVAMKRDAGARVKLEFGDMNAMPSSSSQQTQEGPAMKKARMDGVGDGSAAVATQQSSAAEAQPVPTFTSSVPFDSERYLPLPSSSPNGPAQSRQQYQPTPIIPKPEYGGPKVNRVYSDNLTVSGDASSYSTPIDTNKTGKKRKADLKPVPLLTTIASHPSSATRSFPSSSALTTSSSSSSSSSASATVASTAGTKFDPKQLLRNTEPLACQTFSNSHRNLNAHITVFLEKLEEMNGNIGDTWRTYAYRKAVGILKRLPYAIRTEEDVRALASIRGMGGKMLSKVLEILRTGSLKKVSDMSSNARIATMGLFTRIHGVGASTAQQWYAWGLRSIPDVLRDPRVKLSSVQRVGIEFMEDKSVRIPRHEVKTILEYVQRIANRILPGVTVICCGSYRRGAPSSGDVDLLFTHPSFTTRLRDSLRDGEPVETRESAEKRERFLKQLIAILQEPIEEGSQRWKEEKAWTEEKYAHIKQELDRVAAAKAKMAANGSSQGSNNSTSPPPVAAASSSSSASASSTSSSSRFSASSSTPSPPPASISSAAAAGITPHGQISPLTGLVRPPPPKSFLTGNLSSFDKLSSRHGQAYMMGFCSLPTFHPLYSGIHRRLDLKVYPAPHFPFALLYFTGSDHFNRSMRFWAKKKKLTLSDHGLKPAIRVNATKVWSGKSYYCQTEKDIFDALGLVYVPPEQRNVYSHFDRAEEEVSIIRQQLATNTSDVAAGIGAESEMAAAAAATPETSQVSTSSTMRAGVMIESEGDVDHPALQPRAQLIKSENIAAAASSSSASVPGARTDPLSTTSLPAFPLKQEVVEELSEMEQIVRAEEQMRRIHQEEEAIRINQTKSAAEMPTSKQV